MTKVLVPLPSLGTLRYESKVAFVADEESPEGLVCRLFQLDA